MLRRALLGGVPLLSLICLSFQQGETFEGAGDHPRLIRAAQNLTADPLGRVVDITFDRAHELVLPDDNSLLEVDLVRPLARDASFCVDDLNGDDLADLFAASFNGTAFFFPGLDGHPYRFGEGVLVRRTDSLGSPYSLLGAEWEGCASADLDGDGKREIVVGRHVFSMERPNDPTLLRIAGLVVPFEERFFLDPFPAVADWDEDGRPDILMTDGTVPARAWLYRNQSSPGNLHFEEELLTGSYVRSFLGERGLSEGDLNSDGLFDLISFRGIYFNAGSPGSPLFDFENPTPYPVEGGPWVDGVNSDQAISIRLWDADGDGLLDAYVSNYGTSVWQGSFYRNVGSGTSPAFAFESPLLCRSAPYDHSYRGRDEPSFSSERPYAAVGDVDRDGRTEILVTSESPREPVVLWNRATNVWEPASKRQWRGTLQPTGAQTGDRPRFSYQDLYTFPTEGFPNLDPYGVFNPNWLRNGTVAWGDYTGDGLEDLIHEVFEGLGPSLGGRLSIFERQTLFPLRFSARQGLTTTSGGEVRGLGWAEIDIDGEGGRDLIVGVPEDVSDSALPGQLYVYRNQDDSGRLVLSDPFPLLDEGANPIDVGTNAWPTAFDWDADGDPDLLVSNQAGQISIFLNQDGMFRAGGLVSVEDWDPVASGIVGGGLLSPSLASANLVGDEASDLVMGDPEFTVVWLFENRRALGSAENRKSVFPGSREASQRPTGPSPNLGLDYASVSRTIPGVVERLSSTSYRLYFGIPVLGGETLLYFHDRYGDPDPEPLLITEQQSFYFPYSRGGQGSFTGYAASNFSDRPARLVFQAFLESGDRASFPVNPAEFVLQPGTQLALQGFEIFGLGSSDAHAAWIELISDTPRVGSFFQFGTSPLDRLDGSVAFTAQEKRFYFSRVFEGPDSFRGQDARTWFALANPNLTPVTLAMTLYPSGPGAGQAPPFPEIRSLPPKGYLYESASEIFREARISGGHVEVEVQSGPGAVGFELIELSQVSTVIGLNASPGSGSVTSFSAQLASGPTIFTSVNLVNTTDSTRNLVLRAIEAAGGSPAPPIGISLGPREQFSLDAADLVRSSALTRTTPSGDVPFVGSLRIDADGGGVVGDVIFGDPVDQQFAAALPLQDRPFRKAVFSHVANLANFFTGLAFYFPGPGTTEITVDVFSREGVLVGRGMRTLAAGQRLSELVTQLVPDSSGQAGGYVVVEASGPIIGQLIFGAIDRNGSISLFSAVPPAVIS